MKTLDYLVGWKSISVRPMKKMKVRLYQFFGYPDADDENFILSFGYYVDGVEGSFVEFVEFDKKCPLDEESCIFDIDQGRYLTLNECQTYDSTKPKFEVSKQRNIAIDVEVIDDETVRVVGGYGQKKKFGVDVLNKVLI